MSSGFDGFFLLPISALPSAAVAYLIPITAAAAWSAATAYRAFDRRTERARPSQQVWWTFPVLLWGLTATIWNIDAFDVLVESYSRAMYISVYLAFNEAIASLCLVLLLQLPGLLASLRLPAAGAKFSWSLGAVSAVAAVIVGYLFSVSVCAGFLLE